MKKKLSEPLRLRKKLALELAELAIEYLVYGANRDSDYLAGLIEVRIPPTYDEILVELDEMRQWKDQPKGTGFSIVERLHVALGLEKERFSLEALMSAVIDRLEKHKGKP